MPISQTGSAKAYQGFIEVDACQRSWRLERPADLETLWNSISESDFAEDERLPYWVELWPASLALAMLLEKNQERIKGRLCLDLGCGLGFTALVGALFGARVVALDYEREALGFAQKNARINGISQPLWVVMDWRAPALFGQCADFIWAGDIIYEHRFIEPILSFLEHALKKDGVVWIAEPARNVYKPFREALEERCWASVKVAAEKVEPLHVQKASVSVNLWELSRR